MKKNIIPKLILGSACLLAFGNTSYATETKVDVTPPFGRIAIVGATEVNDVNYVERKEVTIQIYAKDDTCADEEIKYYISTTPIDRATRLDDSVWKTYTQGKTETMTLPDLTSTNIFYAVFKDKYDNISTIYDGGNTEYTIKYNANGGTGAPKDQIGHYGMALNLTTAVPEKEGFYFLGWSTNAGATKPSYEQGDIVPASVFNGANQTINLYAIWTNTADRTTIVSR